MSGTPNHAKPKLSLTVQYASGATQMPPRWRLRRWVQAALACRAALTLRFVETAEGRRLNRDYRGKDYPTNVLTFVYPEERGLQLGGDIVICVPVLREEARRRHLVVEAHCAHLVMHGVLHVQGWEHETEEQAVRMEARETALLKRFGYGDPYHRRGSRG